MQKTTTLFRLSVVVLLALIVALLILFAYQGVQEDADQHNDPSLTENSLISDTPPKKDLPPDQTPENITDTKSDGETLNGPYWQNLIFSSSPDGKIWSETTTIVEHASGPDALVLDKNIGRYHAGDVLVVMTYYPENLVGAGELSMMSSNNEATSWTDPSLLTLEGASGHIPVDPSLYQDTDGTLLLVYQDLRESKDGVDEHVFYVASSTDGVTFTYEGEIFSSEEFIIHPDLIAYENQWFLFYGLDNREREVRFSTSNKYTSFTTEQTTDMEGIPGSFIWNDELVILGCDLKGMIMHRLTDDLELERIDSTQIGGCSPSPIVLSNGDIGVIRTYNVDPE